MASVGPDSYPRGHAEPRVAAVIAALEAAYRLLEQDVPLVPDPDHIWGSRPWWGRSDASRESLMRDIDAFFASELRDHAEHWSLHRGVTLPPLFAQLPDRGRLALAQRLDQALSIPWLPAKEGSEPVIETETPEE